MIELVFQMLNGLGFDHPIHPAMTHVPMGMVMGGFVFGVVSFFLRHAELGTTAHHCFILALIGVLPTVLLGYMDWQHMFEAEWSDLILIKVLLAVLLGILLILSVRIGKKNEPVSVRVLVLYSLCLVNIIALGFAGGELQYG